jgi:two-component system cell cycle response regulator DivK
VVSDRFASGLDATRLLKKDDQTKNIPIIAVTALVTPAIEANAFESGCDAYVAKPINIESMMRTVESFLGPACLLRQLVRNKTGVSV